uniref:PiggyBac transposable element-derived protein domain-containing protein n=1 Tax=Glossina palpalis gambiensis TaxID=67801 RepID=A0A1B0AR49_9MUSC
MEADDYWESFEISEDENDNEIDNEFFVDNLVRFKGRVTFITYNPNKPTKWGIKIVKRLTYTIYLLCSITSENLVRPDLPISTRIPLYLF